MDAKMEENKEQLNDNLQPATEVEPVKEKEYVTIEEFARLDLRVAQIIACEKMEKADKLLIMRVKVGEEERTVVAGIARHYEPEQLIGKKVVIVANLKPTKLRGTLSEGMILAASDADNVEVLMIQSDISAGNRVK